MPPPEGDHFKCGRACHQPWNSCEVISGAENLFAGLGMRTGWHTKECVALGVWLLQLLRLYNGTLMPIIIIVQYSSSTLILGYCESPTQ